MTQWQNLCPSRDLPESESRGYSLERGADRPPLAVLAVRRGGQVYVYRNLCPHAFIPLEWSPDEFLSFDRSLIQCANHGALFKIEDGECVSGPCVGQSLIKIPARESEGNIEIDAASINPG